MCHLPSLHALGVQMVCGWHVIITGMVLTADVDNASAGIVDEVCSSWQECGAVVEVWACTDTHR